MANDPSGGPGGGQQGWLAPGEGGAVLCASSPTGGGSGSLTPCVIKLRTGDDSLRPGMGMGDSFRDSTSLPGDTAQPVSTTNLLSVDENCMQQRMTSSQPSLNLRSQVRARTYFLHLVNNMYPANLEPMLA